MPQQLNVLTPDGQQRSIPIPDGMNPTPEEVGELVRQAGIQTVQVTSEQPKPASTSSKPPGQPTTPGEAMNKSLTSIYRAIADRTVDPATTLFGPDSSMLGRAGAAMQLGGTIAAAPFAAAGAGVQAATEAAGADPATARLVGSAAEIGFGLWNLGRSIWGTKERARAVLSAVKTDVPEAGGMSRAERIGQEVQTTARGHFSQVQRELGGEFNRLEAQMIRETPAIAPGSPAYDDIDHVFNYLDDAQASAGGKAETVLSRIKAAKGHTAPDGTPDPQPVRMSDLIKLRKILHERAGVAAPFDPDASVVGKKAAEMRDLTMDVIRGGAAEDTAAAYDMTRNAWRTQIAEPESFLKAVTRNNVTPLSAFKAVFSTDDPQRLRVVATALQQNPAMQAKLRLGFAESMTPILKGELTPKAAVTRLENFRPLLESSGLYTARELDDLKFLMDSNRVPGLISELTSNARASQVMLRGSVGAAMATHISSHPATLLVSALAFGGIPQLRRAAMLPEGSMAQRQLMAIILRNTAAGMQRVFTSPAVGDEPGVRGSRAAVR